MDAVRDFGRFDRIIGAIWPRYQTDLTTFLLNGIVRVTLAFEET